MTLQLSPEQEEILKETRRVDTIEDFEALRGGAKAELDKVFTYIKVQEPNKPVDDIVTTLRGIYLQVVKFAPALSLINYKEADRHLFRDSIRLVDTAHLWFSTNLKEGSWRPRKAQEVIKASRPWRARLRLMGESAFPYDPETSKKFADVNSTETITEERQDLRDLLKLIKDYPTELVPYGLNAEFSARGGALLNEAEGHGLLKSLGLIDQKQAIGLRNLLATYAVTLGRKALSNGKLALFENPVARQNFESFSLSNTLRRIQERSSGGQEEEVSTPEEAPQGEGAPEDPTPQP